MKDITVKLNIKPETTPKFMKARSVPYAIRSKVGDELDALVKSGVLEPVTVSEWATPIVPVPKKTGGIRICGDFKVTLNPVLSAEQYPLPRIDDLFAGLSKGQKFSKIDLNQAYLQMHIHEDSKDLLTITTQKGLFRYCRLPSGITSAPALFQRAMDQILHGLPGVQCYLDDILCTGSTDQEHLDNLDAALQRLKEYGLRVHKDKSEPRAAEIFYFSQVDGAPVSAAHVRRASRTDPVLSAVMDMVMGGRSGSDAPSIQPYLSRRAELSVQSGCLLWGRRVVIPPSLRKSVLQQLHAGHSGIVRMKEIARNYFWWPGVDREIENTAKTCSSCQEVRKAPQLAPLHPWEFPEEPWQRVHIDFAGPVEGYMLLVCVDAHSKWPEVAIMKTTTTARTIERLGEIFSRFGSPLQLVSDNGPQLVSQEMTTFLEANGVQHIRSAPFHPATNGLAERFVQTMKKALKTSQEQGSFHQRLHRFLLSNRNTPHATTKVSPASLMFKRNLRTNFDFLKPTTVKDIVQHQQEKQIQQRMQKAKERVFSPDEPVLARNYSTGPRWVPATIVKRSGPVSYTVSTAAGLVWKRHVDQLLQATASTPNQPSVDTPNESEFSAPHFLLPPPQRTMEYTGETSASDSSLRDPVMDVPTRTAVPESPSGDRKTEHSVEPRYPVRERRPPERLDL
ncbi:uncharacterized protein K02A2.6-like [Entelurus aequoreus]|uniref:uncharacterized protein K02A2.6-like n=1 Tax=Entelurus aequoreus TaxID=161455 RepID=UPI002B1CFFC5|nr:uncharacterized protein K02A2.6-like [Entelurus aequoreus]